MTTLQEILDAAHALPSPERVRLIHALWDTVSPDDWDAPSTEWVQESQYRSKEYDKGSISVSPWAEVRERARRKAGLDG